MKNKIIPRIRTTACCPKCGKELLLSNLPDYTFQCEECDEDFYRMEVKEFNGDFFEISFTQPYRNYFEENESLLQAIADKYNVPYLGFDELIGFVDFGFEEIPSSETIHTIRQELGSFTPCLISKEGD